MQPLFQELGGFGFQLTFNPGDGKFQHSKAPGEAWADVILVQLDFLLDSDERQCCQVK
jgi:hypothetical protein